MEHTKIHSRSPVRPSPRPSPRMERERFGFSLGSAPRSYPRRTPEWRRSIGHWTGSHRHSRPPIQPVRSLITCDLTSHSRPQLQPGRCDDPAMVVFHLHINSRASRRTKQALNAFDITFDGRLSTSRP